MLKFIYSIFLIISAFIISLNTSYAEENKSFEINANILDLGGKFSKISTQSIGCFINIQYTRERSCGNNNSPESLNLLVHINELDFQKTEIKNNIVSIEYNDHIKKIINSSKAAAIKKFPRSLAKKSNEVFSLSVKRLSYQLLIAKSKGINSQFSTNMCEGYIKQYNLLPAAFFSIKKQYSKKFLEDLKSYAEKNCR